MRFSHHIRNLLQKKLSFAHPPGPLISYKIAQEISQGLNRSLEIHLYTSSPSGSILFLEVNNQAFK